MSREKKTTFRTLSHFWTQSLGKITWLRLLCFGTFTSRTLHTHFQSSRYKEGTDPMRTNSRPTGQGCISSVICALPLSVRLPWSDTKYQKHSPLHMHKILCLAGVWGVRYIGPDKIQIIVTRTMIAKWFSHAASEKDAALLPSSRIVWHTFWKVGPTTMQIFSTQTDLPFEQTATAYSVIKRSDVRKHLPITLFAKENILVLGAILGNPRALFFLNIFYS